VAGKPRVDLSVEPAVAVAVPEHDLGGVPLVGSTGIVVVGSHLQHAAAGVGQTGLEPDRAPTRSIADDRQIAGGQRTGIRVQSRRFGAVSGACRLSRNRLVSRHRQRERASSSAATAVNTPTDLG